MPTVRRPLAALLVVLVLLGAGLAVAVVVGDALGIRTEPSEQMPDPAAAVPAAAVSVAPPRLASVRAPSGERMAVALDELRGAVADAGRTSGETTLTVTVGTGDPDDDTYRLSGSAAALTVTAPSLTGGVRGVYDLAHAVRTGHAVTEHLGEEVRSRLPFRMVDLGAVGVAPDPAEWASGTDYSHASRAFEDVLLPDAPYIDAAALDAAYADFDAFVRHCLAGGYTALAFPGLVEFVTFDDAPWGPVYAPGDEHRARALAMRSAFGRFWDRAEQLGMKVYLRTDMLALTTPLEGYLERHVGSLDTTDPALWRVYTAGLDELYAAAPSLDGVLVRIGEAGAVYDVEGWDYYSALAVTSVDGVRAMLTAFTDQAERTRREVVFRTWSVGVGAVGDMHTNAASYRAVLDGLDSPALVVSTKYTLGDFYSHLPVNDTLEQGSQRRIVEFQSRREFENYGAFPNDLGPQLQAALQRLLAANEHIEGVWVWTQDGGPWRAGPMTLYLKAGFWQLYELNTQVAGALARDPDADVGRLTADWARQWFSDDPATVRDIGEAMAASRRAVSNGLYIGPFADQRVFALGLEPPPMMWIFEWDILTGDSAVLDVVYAVSHDRLDEALAEGRAAVADAERMRERVASSDAATWRDTALRQAFLDTLDYEVDSLRMLAAYREMFLRQAQWHDTGSGAVHERWATARDEFERRAAGHLARYDGDVDHPAYNLTAARLGVARADRDLPMAWAARVLLVVVLGWLVLGALGGPTGGTGGPLGAAARAAWAAAATPWRAAEATAGLGRGGRVALVVVPLLVLALTRGVQTWFLAPVNSGVLLAAWGAVAAVLLVGLRRRGVWPAAAALGGVLVARCALTLLALAPTGPGGYWFAFWTEPGRRTVYVTVAVAFYLWMLVATGWAAASALGARRASGTVVAAVGAGLAVPALWAALVGLEASLTAWNDDMGVLPWGMSRILGITVYLGIPADAAWWAAAAGTAVVLGGVLLALPWRRRRPAPA